MFSYANKGSAAPLALLFTVVSMFFTTAYLKNSFSQAAMEKYRYTEWKALYAAEEPTFPAPITEIFGRLDNF